MFIPKVSDEEYKNISLTAVTQDYQALEYIDDKWFYTIGL